MQLWTEATDEDLLDGAWRGDETAFTALYRRRHPGIYRFAHQMTGNSATAEEVTQEVFLELLRDGRGYDRSRGPLAAYLFGIARNRVRRHLERERAWVPIDEESAAEWSDTADGQCVLSRLSRAEQAETLRRAILGLPSGYREVLVLCELEEMSYAEAASALECPVGTVRSRLSRARGMLLEKLRSTKGGLLSRCLV